MHRRLLLIPLLLLAAPLAAAGTVGDLSSDAPVDLFGAATVGGSAVRVFHEGFANASFSATLHAGRIVDRERHVDCSGRPYERENVLANATSDALPAPIYFETDEHSLSVVDLGASKAFGLASGPGTDAQRPDASPVARLGPNPYALATQQRDVPGTTSAWATAFPTGAFLAVPTGDLRTAFRGVVTIELGNLTLVQGGQTHVYGTKTTLEATSCNPAPILPTPGGTSPVAHTIRIIADSSVLTIRQAGVERLLAYYKGDASPTDPRGASGANVPRGYWTKGDPGGASNAYRSYALPSTVVDAPDLTMGVEGVAVLHDAKGSLFDGGIRRDLSGEEASLSGDLQIAPKGIDNGGREMETSIDGTLYRVDKGPVAPGRDLTPFLAGVAGGAILLGLALYAAPNAKWGFAKWFLVPLYARLRKDEILENPLRDDILQAVQDEPGISASELGRRMECGWGTLVYHLTVLERMQLVSSAREGRHKRFFAQGRINYSDKGAVGLLANPAAKTILDAIRGAPGLMQKELSERLHLSPGTVAWHVDRLSGEGLVVKEEDGRSVRYYPSDRLLDLTRRLAA